jgi:hypothetical protein
MPIKLHSVLMVLLILCLTSLHSSNASIVGDIYDANIAVSDQSSRAQDQAFSVAIKQVLLKVSGNKALLSDPSIKNLAAKARRFVRSYRYDMQQSQLYLVINFDAQRIDDLIRNAGFPIWDKRRPDTLVWLAIQPAKDSERQILNATEYADIYQELKLQAKQRGIRLIFPLWDLDDLQKLGVYDIWGGFSARISQASERYEVQSVLSARIYLSDNTIQNTDDGLGEANPTSSWTADWTMIESGKLVAGEIQAASVSNIAVSLVDNLANQLAQKYAIDLSQSETNDLKVEIVINNIDSLTYYKQALALLENLSVVSNATLIKQQGVGATFELQLLGQVDDLVNALSLDRKIRPVVDDFGQPVGELQFFWVK